MIAPVAEERSTEVEELPLGVDPPSAEQAVVAEAPRRRAANHADGLTPTSQPVPDLAEEAELIERARGRLRSAPGEALAIAEEHAERFGDAGQLEQEREALAIEALIRLERARSARSRFERFEARWPRSAYRTRLNQLLQEQ